MKKNLLLVLAIILCFTFVACGNKGGTEKPNNETVDNGGEQTNNPAGDDSPKENALPEGIKAEDFYKFVQFELPENFREAAVAQMRKQAAIEWTPEYTFTYGNKFDNWGYEKTYEAGVKYTGLPYGALNSNMSEFQKYLDEHRGRYATVSDNGYYEVMGTQCNTALNLSYQLFYPEACHDSGAYMPSYSDKFIGVKLGDIVVPEGVKKTLDICAANTEQAIYESYALADKGDPIMGKNDETWVTHVRMVAEKAVVSRGANGNINPNRSYIICVEQTDSWDETRKDIKTTWWMDHKYTFNSLYQAGWIVSTLEIFNDNKSVIPYLALDEEITADMLSKGNLVGTVSSDYPVNYVHLTIYNKAGKIVNRVVEVNEYEGNKVNLRKQSFNLFTDKLTPGTEYTFVLDAGIASGSVEFCRIDFTYAGK